MIEIKDEPGAKYTYVEKKEGKQDIHHDRTEKKRKDETMLSKSSTPPRVP